MAVRTADDVREEMRGATRAVRLLLPRRLHAQVVNELGALDLRAALSELKSYRAPPDAVRKVVLGVLCLLGRRRTDLLDWKMVQARRQRQQQLQ